MFFEDYDIHGAGPAPSPVGGSDGLSLSVESGWGAGVMRRAIAEAMKFVKVEKADMIETVVNVGLAVQEQLNGYKSR